MKTAYALVVGFLLLCLSAGGTPSTEAGAVSGVFYVGGTGPGNFSSLQEAVGAAEAGDTIVVLGGIHPPVEVNVSLSLEGRGAVVGGFSVYADSVRISGFLIQGAAYGVYMQGRHNEISNCTIFNNSYGIKIQGNGNVVRDNKIFKNRHYALGLRYSFQGFMVRNAIYWNQWGIYLEHSEDNDVLFNLLHHNGQGIRILGGSDNIIGGNHLANNSEYGIKMCCSSHHNSIFGNNFIDNHIPAYAYTADENRWDQNGTGNYWGNISHHTAYVIDDENADYHPATTPFAVPQFDYQIFVLQPMPHQILSGPVVVRGVSEQEGTVEVRVDNGTWQRAVGFLTWQYLLDTADLDNGPHRLSLRCGPAQTDYYFQVQNEAASGFAVLLPLAVFATLAVARRLSAGKQKKI
ncbi:MAG: NosD domain-containing protein [Candidatus Thermoplasmatota archaeon]|nr:NosD domain-containing protein [Candidatus Thermoplasmatota archaeon]